MKTDPLPATPRSEFRQHAIKVFLIDDQLLIGEAVRRMLAGEPGIEFKFCSDPAKAEAMAVEFQPTLILLDLVMPGIDGLTMVKTFRANPETLQIPLIVLSAKEEPKIKAEAFAIGANDYLVKLPDKIELIARIRYHSNAYITLLQRNEAYEALMCSQRALAAELQEAAEYVRSLLPAPMIGSITTSWKFFSSTSLGGDAFGYHWLDDDNFAIFLLDVCGHGVGAALLSVSIMNSIKTRPLLTVDFHQPNQVLKALNAAYPMEKNNNMYFTMWYGVYNKTSRKLTYSTGGHPPAVMISGNPGTQGDGPSHIEMLRTRGMMIGALMISDFENDETEIPAGARLFVFSDGAYEVKRPGREMMELDELVEILVPDPGDSTKLDMVVDEVRRQQGHDNFVDDFSLLEIRFE
ncbi:MAG: SpoIIE family protein phosphatase [Candidatus Methylacidiphilales bacterium]|nr:fused response regulator/phosphatase [Candidatus Methylacidiphilales bacterium]